MYLDFENSDVLEIEFKKELNWFEDEFDLLFGNKLTNCSPEEISMGNKLLDLLSEVINNYPAEELLFFLVSKLNKIKNRYPELFKH